MAWLRSTLGRLPSRARLVVIAAAGLVLLSIVASALSPASHPRHRTRGTPGLTAPSRVTTTVGTPRRPPRVSAAELARARAVAAQFLESYLPFLYGRAPARSVAGVAPAFRRELTRERAQLTPVE